MKSKRTSRATQSGPSVPGAQFQWEACEAFLEAWIAYEVTRDWHLIALASYGAQRDAAPRTSRGAP